MSNVVTTDFKSDIGNVSTCRGYYVCVIDCDRLADPAHGLVTEKKAQNSIFGVLGLRFTAPILGVTCAPDPPMSKF